MRLSYDDVALAVPVTVPYVRHSIRGAHWFLARALADLLKTSGLPKNAIDGLTELHARARHRGRPDPAARAYPPLARPHPDGRRERHRGAAARRARGAERGRQRRRLPRRRPQPRGLVPARSREL